jgi:signal transduction histidine kinase
VSNLVIKPLSSIYLWLIEPKSQGSDARRREFILNVLLTGSLVLSLTALLIVIVNEVVQPNSSTGSPLAVAIAVALFLVMIAVSRRGFSVGVAYALVALYFILAFYSLFHWGISLSIGTLILALVLDMSSILIGTRFAVIMTCLSIFALIGLGAMQQSHMLLFDSSWMQTPGGLSDAVIFSFALAVITTVSWLSNREIERFNLTLQERVHEATKRLSVANRNLRVLDKAKDEFIGMASHQLGTPLTAITGYLSMTLDDPRKLGTHQREYINFALEASERLAAMTRDLLDVSRLNSGRFVIQRQPVDLSRLTAQEVQQLRPAAERKGIKLLYDPPATAMTLNVDESKTRQVIMNLIDNAIYYTAKGTVSVQLQTTADHVEFTVTDTGIGVPVAERAKLFAKFYRGSNAQETRPDGTGLGLFLAKRVIEGQDGEIIFASEIGKGSTFGFKLPLQPARP